MGDDSDSYKSSVGEDDSDSDTENINNSSSEDVEDNPINESRTITTLRREELAHSGTLSHRNHIGPASDVAPDNESEGV